MGDDRGWSQNTWVPESMKRWATRGFQRTVDQARSLPPEEGLEQIDKLLASAYRKDPDSYFVTMLQAELALHLERLERLDEARLFREEVLSDLRRHLGNEHESTLMAEEQLAQNLQVAGLAEKAAPRFLHVYDARRSALGPDRPDTLRAEIWLARSLADTGRSAEAKVHFHHVHDSWVQLEGPENEAALRAKQWADALG